MVAVSEWVAANTPPDDLIAAHDIGALGYFARRPLLDLAGLVSPEVIPFIRDEMLWLITSYPGCSLPGHLPRIGIPSSPPRLNSSTRQWRDQPSLGYENMAVYRWPAER
jgi:hypothetical protein